MNFKSLILNKAVAECVSDVQLWRRLFKYSMNTNIKSEDQNVFLEEIFLFPHLFMHSILLRTCLC